MATPNEASVQNQLGTLMFLFDQLNLYLNTNAENFQGHYDDSVTVQDNDFAAEALSALDNARGSLNDAMLLHATVFTPLLKAYAKVLDFPESDVQAILFRLYEDFVTNSKSVKSRAFTFATPAAITGTGDGVITRLNTDANAQDIENQTPDRKDARCRADAMSGAQQHEEVFELTSGAASRDLIPGITGSGLTDTIKAVSGADAQRQLSNPSFSSFTGTAGSSPTAVEGWTEGTNFSNFTMLQTAADVYRGYRGDTTPTSIRFDAVDSLTQALTVRDADYGTLTPYYLQIAIKRNSTATGSISLTLGSKTKVVDIATLADGAWNIIRLEQDEDAWFTNWNNAAPTVKIDVTTLAVGTVTVDDVILVPYVQFDGSWYVIVGGQAPFLVDDVSNWTDTATDAGIVQRMFWRAFNFYLPHNAAAGETWTEPS